MGFSVHICFFSESMWGFSTNFIGNPGFGIYSLAIG